MIFSKRGELPSVKKSCFFLFILAGLLIVVISLFGFTLLRLRPGLPQGINMNTLLQFDGVNIQHQKDVEFLLSRKSLGEWGRFVIKKEGKTEIIEAPIIPFYSRVPFPLIYLIIGLMSLAIGFIVFLVRREEVKARIFYWLALAFSSTLIIEGGFFCLRQNWLSYIPGLFTYVFYPLAPALLLHFSISFSQKRLRFGRIWVYGPAIIFIGLLGTTFLWSSLKGSLEAFRLYSSIFYFFRFYVILFILLSIIHLILLYRKTPLEEGKDQIKWVFWGLLLGLGPFIFLYQMPQIFRIKPLFSDEFVSLFFVFIPLGFALSILRFKLMNVDLVINRSLVYSLLTIFTVSVYLSFVQISSKLFAKLVLGEEMVISLMGVVLAAVAFHPARRKIQEFVDKAFFRLSYDYRKCLLDFTEKAQNMIKKNQLVDFYLKKVKIVLPMENLGVHVYTAAPEGPEPYISKGVLKDFREKELIGVKPERLLAKKRSVSTAENMDFTQEPWLEERQLEMVLPLTFRSTSLAGFLSLGKKKSGERYSRDDLELLILMARELALNLERIKLHEEVIYERVSREKLDELNRLKTEFISTVSHELRTPMSSIQGLSEILGAGKVKDKAKRGELLNIIACESSRLSRLLHNILDFGKIEQQVNTFDFQKIELNPVIAEAAELFQYILDREGFTFGVDCPDQSVYLDADRDAVKQALINLIDNAIKYSSNRKVVEIRLEDNPHDVQIHVKDRGIGIPQKEQKRIFKQFYRISKGVLLNPKGVGLGLKIVKHIMDAHNGEVRVKSESGRGSTFTLFFSKP